MPTGAQSSLGTWYWGAEDILSSGLVQKSSEARGKIVAGSDAGSRSLLLQQQTLP